MTREVIILGHRGAMGLELVGTCEVLQLANYRRAQRGEPAAYRVGVVSPGGGELPLFAGIALASTGSLRDHSGSIDLLVVVGGPEALTAATDAELVDALREAAGRARRVVSLCTGAFLLAAAGLLDGRRATTHWLFGDELATRHPAVDVQTDPIFVRDGDVWTSAGITAALDLLLAVVEEDEGSDAARWIARMLVVYLRRTGNQAQFSAQLSGQLADRHPIRELQQYIVEHPEADLSQSALAARANLSPRQFARLFVAETGVSPGRYVERVRIETARRRLEESELSVEQIAVACGFGNAGNFRRVFARELGVSPLSYRRTFGARPAAGALAAAR